MEERKNQTESGGKKEPNREWRKEGTKQKVEETEKQTESRGKKGNVVGRPVQDTKEVGIGLRLENGMRNEEDSKGK